jgi:3-hydroxyisobutyrate dehydrogenase-like beta-hydroxyacid dehydrogenase
MACEVLANSAVAAPFVHYRRALFERPDLKSPQMRLELAAKDLGLIEALAGGVGASLPQSTTNRQVLEEAIADGRGDDDVTAVAEYLRARQP